jgi:hypothetical protein
MVNFSFKILWQCTIFASMLVCSSCRGREEQADYTEDDVKKYVQLGITTRSELSSRFGNPLSETKASDGTPVLIYHRPFIIVNGREHLADKEGFTGFKVYLQNDKVVRWDPIVGDKTVR